MYKCRRFRARTLVAIRVSASVGSGFSVRPAPAMSMVSLRPENLRGEREAYGTRSLQKPCNVSAGFEKGEW